MAFAHSRLAHHLFRSILGQRRITSAGQSNVKPFRGLLEKCGCVKKSESSQDRPAGDARTQVRPSRSARTRTDMSSRPSRPTASVHEPPGSWSSSCRIVSPTSALAVSRSRQSKMNLSLFSFFRSWRAIVLNPLAPRPLRASAPGE